MLTKVRAFAAGHGIHIWFVAHPTKMQRDSEGKIPPPGGFDISGCHDEQTEALTTRGWVRHADLVESDMIAAYNPIDGTMRYEKPSHIHVYDHDGEMHHWIGPNLDLMVTPNHRMVAKRFPDSQYSFVESKNITAGRWYFPSSANMEDPPYKDQIDIDLGYETKDLLWFIGFWVAEGCIQMNSLSVCQAEDSCLEPKAVMDRLGLQYSEKISDGRFNEKLMWVARLRRRWHIDLIDFVARECGVGAANKKLPDFIWKLDRQSKLAFLEGYWYGDGTTKNNSREAVTISKQLSDDIQRLAVECGFFSAQRTDLTKEDRWSDRYNVVWREQEYRSVQIDRNLEKIHYRGKVYCVTVSTGAYVTRRNGKVAFQGNSAAWFAKADCGLTVHREKDDPLVAQIHLWKVRFSWVGKQGQANLLYNVGTTRYVELMDQPKDEGFQL